MKSRGPQTPQPTQIWNGSGMIAGPVVNTPLDLDYESTHEKPKEEGAGPLRGNGKPKDSEPILPKTIYVLRVLASSTPKPRRENCPEGSESA